MSAWQRCRVWMETMSGVATLDQSIGQCETKPFLFRMHDHNISKFYHWDVSCVILLGRWISWAGSCMTECMYIMHAHDHVIQVLGHEIQFMHEHFDAWVYQSECSCIKYDMFRPTPSLNRTCGWMASSWVKLTWLKQTSNRFSIPRSKLKLPYIFSERSATFVWS